MGLIWLFDGVQVSGGKAGSGVPTTESKRVSGVGQSD